MDQYDAVIVGAGFSGASAALTLGRSLRKTLLVGSGAPRNTTSPHAHNLLSRDGHKPSDILKEALEQLKVYPSVKVVDDLVTTVEKTDSHFSVTLANGNQVSCKHVILCTGVKDAVPEKKGFKECWGKSLLHCPYCHGFEVANQRLAVLGNSEMIYHHLKRIRHWSKDTVLLTDGPCMLNEEQRASLDEKGISVIQTPIQELCHQDGKVSHVLFEDQTSRPFDAIFSAFPVTQRAQHARELGCEFVGNMTGFESVKVDPFGRTSVPGVWACGDMTTMMHQLAYAANSGATAGAFVNMDLLETEPF